MLPISIKLLDYRVTNIWNILTEKAVLAELKGNTEYRSNPTDIDTFRQDRNL